MANTARNTTLMDLAQFTTEVQCRHASLAALLAQLRARVLYPQPGVTCPTATLYIKGKKEVLLQRLLACLVEEGKNK